MLQSLSFLCACARMRIHAHMRIQAHTHASTHAYKRIETPAQEVRLLCPGYHILNVIETARLLASDCASLDPIGM